MAGRPPREVIEAHFTENVTEGDTWSYYACKHCAYEWEFVAEARKSAWLWVTLLEHLLKDHHPHLRGNVTGWYGSRTLARLT